MRRFPEQVGTILRLGEAAGFIRLQRWSGLLRNACLDVLGVVHHVMARGIEGRLIFLDDRDREEFVRRKRPDKRLPTRGA